ncbi:hypothetical protein CLG96_06550 [Sphingomonas oleivorans]|uniref:Uncharacterized protein n=1 Tax=Sphingomonas oleivorans TaxID=1735121 RepID=A0A2T5FZW8_9SPHN|nr:hypothetical protein [Sphingomonas oleivorans]PTQ12207.1 hypothetical protein CLG96_06550 [Sphingomonas oleivorans]
MLTPIAALLLAYSMTALLALFAAVTLWRPLSVLLGEMCGTEQRSRFWTVWSTAMMVATPMLIVSIGAIATDPVRLVKGTVASALTGILFALIGMGFAVWSRSPRAAA